MCHVRRVPVTTASQRNICAEWKSNLGTGEASRNISILRDLIGGKEAILPQQGIGTASEWPTISESAHGGVWLLLSRYSLNTCRWPRQMIFTSCALRQLGRNHEGSGGRGAFEYCSKFFQLPEYRRPHWIRQQKQRHGGRRYPSSRRSKIRRHRDCSRRSWTALQRPVLPGVPPEPDVRRNQPSRGVARGPSRVRPSFS